MELKARQLVIDPDNPFAGDLLGRQSEVENLTTLLSNLNPPMVLAVNGRWGAGKTTFVQMWASYLKQKGLPVLSFNAWETDFSEDPLVAFLGEMNQNLGEYLTNSGAVTESWERCKKVGGEIAKRAIPGLVRIATAGVINVNELIQGEAVELLGTAATDAVKSYEQTRSAIGEFKEMLANVITEANMQLPLVIFVDELDRCRPTYAIQLLERIKHLFDQPEIVFVLSLDLEQLCHSIRAVYGEGLDAAGYLRRFIDIEYTLSSPSPEVYIQQLYTSFGLSEYFEVRKKYREFQYDSEHLVQSLCWMCQTFDYTLRDIEQLFSRVNLALRATPEDRFMFPSLLVFLIVLKDTNTGIYRAFIRDNGEVAPVIDYLYSLMPKEQRLNNFHFSVLEGLLLASKAQTDKSCDERLLGYRRILQANEAGQDEVQYAERTYADTIIHVLKDHTGARARVSLKELFHRIELISQFKFPEQEENS